MAAAVVVGGEVYSSVEDSNSKWDGEFGRDVHNELTAEERQVLDKVGEALARLGRVKRVGVGVKEKGDFIRVWSKRRH